ncbi:hypothetical protein ACOMHN_000712 [Nucella lapillus]
MHYAYSPPLPLLHVAMRTVRRKAFMALLLLCTLGLLLYASRVPSLLLPAKHPPSTNKTSLPPVDKGNLSASLRSAIRGENSSMTTVSSGNYFLTVIPRGRLGNQMFEYASLLGIADVNRMTPFVSSVCKVTHYFANISVSDRPVISWNTMEENSYAEKDPLMDSLPGENVRLKGFYQSWKYFAAVKQKVKQAFVFLPDVQEVVLNFFHNMTGHVKNDVIKIGVHVRRTDMLHKITQKQGYVSAPLSYVIKAIQHMRDRFRNQSIIFFVVSDDPDWCREHLQGNGVWVVDSAPSVVHLGFLALCHHVIMTVGTFGWWAAYLSGGHVVYYSGFPLTGSDVAEGFNPQDYYLPQWVPIGD